MGRDGVNAMAFKDTLKKIWKWLVIPFVLIGAFFVRKASETKDVETKKDIRDIDKEIKELKREEKEVKQDFEQVQQDFEQTLSKTEEFVKENLSGKKARDKAAEKFFK